MQPFMNVMKTHPEQVTFLRDDFEKFAKDHVKLRVLSGPFKDYEGYIVRIDRDRQLVFDFGGRAVAIRGVHKELCPMPWLIVAIGMFMCKATLAHVWRAT